MYISKLTIALTNKTSCRASYDAGAMHKQLTGLFECGRKTSDLLYWGEVSSKEPVCEIWMYANRRISKDRLLPWMHLDAETEITDWVENDLANNQVYRFRIKTFPNKKKSNSERRAHGQSATRTHLETRDERISWLERKFMESGCEIIDVEETSENEVYVAHEPEKGGELVLRTNTYTGTLRVSEVEKFRQALKTGIGPNKAYGLGMLFIA